MKTYKEYELFKNIVHKNGNENGWTLEGRHVDLKWLKRAMEIERKWAQEHGKATRFMVKVRTVTDWEVGDLDEILKEVE